MSPPNPEITPGTGHIGPAPPGMEIVEHGRTFDVYKLTREEIRELLKAGSSGTISLAVATTSVGIFATAMAVLWTVDTLSPKASATFSAFALVAGGATIFGGIGAWFAWKRSSRHLRQRYGIGE